MAGQVIVTKKDDVKTSGGQTEGMIRQNALVGVSEKICSSGSIQPLPVLICRLLNVQSSVMLAKPHSSSDIHHHGDLGRLPSHHTTPSLH